MTREKLIDVVEFQYFGRDRRLIAEGHMALSMFFIVTGEVAVSKMLFDTLENKLVNKPISIMSSGESFGHVGMIFNKLRNASLMTKSRLTRNSLFHFEELILVSRPFCEVHRCIDLFNRWPLLLPSACARQPASASFHHDLCNSSWLLKRLTRRNRNEGEISFSFLFSPAPLPRLQKMPCIGTNKMFHVPGNCDYANARSIVIDGSAA